MRYEYALQSARKATKSKRPAIGLLILLVSAALLLTLMACADNAGEQQPRHDSAGAAIPASEHDTSKSNVSLAPTATLTSANSELAVDTIPLRAPDGGLARYGLASGRITQIYGGARRGNRLIMFDHYGMREYALDSSTPYPGGTPGPMQNNIFITTPEIFGNVDRTIRQGWKRPNLVDDTYLKSDSSKRFPLGEIVFMEAERAGKRLPDTVINGFHCRAVEIKQPGFTDTRYFWRGIMLLDRFTPMDGKWFTIETTGITPGITVPDSLFVFPAGYKIETLSADQPIAPMVPNRGGQSGPSGGMQRGMPAAPPMGVIPPSGQ